MKGAACFLSVDSKDIPEGSLLVEHWVMEMFAPAWSGGPKIMSIDWMHIGWRLRCVGLCKGTQCCDR